MAAATSEISAFRRQDAEQLFLQGNERFSNADYAGAAACFHAVTALLPDEVAVWVNMGMAQQALGLHDEAMASYKHALSLQPDNAEAACNLGIALRARKENQQAIALFEPFVKKGNAPNPILYNQMLCLADEADYDGCISLKNELLSRDIPPALRLRTSVFFPPLMPARSLELQELRKLYKTTMENLWQDERMTGALRLPEVVGNSFYLAYHGENDKSLQKGMAAFLRRACPALNFTAPHCQGQKRAAGKRIRLGVFSQYLREHTIGRLFGGILSQIDRQRFELFVLATSEPFDAISRRLSGEVEHFVIIPKKLEEARELIAAIGLDMLFYTDIGMDPFSYSLAFSRLAPIQSVTWGHPVTTGIDTIDFFVTSKELEILPQEMVYSEKTHLLTNPGIYYERPLLSVSKSRSDFQLPEKTRIYLCAQSLFKIHPDFDSIIRKILETDQQGVLLLIGNNNKALSHRIAAGSPDILNRLIFIKSLPRDDYLSLLSMADVLLDTTHFSGGNTTIESFGLGLPVVTMPSSYLKGRISAALYNWMDISDLITSEVSEYVEKACRIAADPEYRIKLSARIMDASSVLFRNRGVINELEVFFSMHTQNF